MPREYRVVGTALMPREYRVVGTALMPRFPLSRVCPSRPSESASNGSSSAKSSSAKATKWWQQLNDEARCTLEPAGWRQTAERVERDTHAPRGPASPQKTSKRPEDQQAPRGPANPTYGNQMYRREAEA
jgi:hypothetical protein